MKHFTPDSNTDQPLAFGSFTNWLRLLWDNKGVERRYLRRAAFVSIVSYLTTPLRLCEQLYYYQMKKTMPPLKPPIFILGHWRSGTTYLHALMSQDPTLAYPSTFQNIAPELYLIGDKTLKPIMQLRAPTQRPMDNMSLSLDGPQEEEFAIANLCPYSFYHHWSFPRRSREYFEKYVLFQNVPPYIITRWKKIYLGILQKVNLKTNGKQLVAKNPVNTGRISLLLDLFPQAKFIHIYRNPYDVYLSTQRLYKKILVFSQLQTSQPKTVKNNILYFYTELMHQFLRQKRLIPPENFVEIRFEDLEKAPLATLEHIYTHLQLSNFAQAEHAFSSYIASQADYRKNEFSLSPEVIQTVNKHWAFAFKEWGYTMLTPDESK